MYFNYVFKPICVCFQEISSSQFLCGNSVFSPSLPNYTPVYRRANPKVPGMRGLYIGPEERLIAFEELEKWLISHNKSNYPAILVGDFNMSFHNIKSYISCYFPDWTVAELIGNNFIWAKGTKSSRIDHIIYNRSIVTPDCPNYCPCCGHGEQTFLYWILLCPALTQYRTTSLGFLHVPYMDGLAAFLTKTIPIISSSMKLLFDRFSKTPNVIKSADVVSIGHRNFSTQGEFSGYHTIKSDVASFFYFI
ncbi:hypothetical protein PIROE2DRAFT_14288 [Piromyces sp. E2]|nr:hypothetical protein PIROE2DRAFT_14288 [Piromyces sp. E2]|eukprot:OUM60033.1 hypothetical protein PIROE2DRAFT_14288 [Piromyces sp. E2]